MDARQPTYLEDRRQLEHLAPLAFAFLLPYLSYGVILTLAAAAVLYALYISPRLIRVTTRPEEAAAGFSRGKLYYALCILILLLLFPRHLELVAAVWAILAVGDSVSNVVGRRWGRRRLPWNPRKSWAGSLAFWVGGTLGAWLLWLWNAPPSEAPLSFQTLGVSALASLLCALAESLPDILDDNIAICWVGATTFFLLGHLSPPSFGLQMDPVGAVLVNLLILVLARWLRWISWGGAWVACLFGIAILTALGPPAYLLILLFLVLGSLATKAGYAHKKRLSLAQPDQGQRGLANVLAKGFIPLLIALFAYWVKHPLLPVAYTAALATSTFDTLGTEIGQWLGKHPYRLFPPAGVPPGTPGALSWQGTAAGLGGAALLAAVAAWMGWISVIGGAAALTGGLLGVLFESCWATFFPHRAPYSKETLNLYSTLVGSFSGGWLWLALGS